MHDRMCPSAGDPEDIECVACDIIIKVREDMLAKCITALEAYAEQRLTVTKKPNMSEDITAALRVAVNRLRALQEKTWP